MSIRDALRVELLPELAQPFPKRRRDLADTTEDEVGAVEGLAHRREFKRAQLDQLDVAGGCDPLLKLPAQRDRGRRLGGVEPTGEQERFLGVDLRLVVEVESHAPRHRVKAYAARP